MLDKKMTKEDRRILNDMFKTVKKAVRSGSRDTELLIKISNCAVYLKDKYPYLPELPIMKSIPSLNQAGLNKN